MKILDIARYDLIKLFRDKAALFFAIILPIVFTFVMGLVFGNASNMSQPSGIPVGIVNYDNSEIAGQLLDRIKENDSIIVYEMEEQQLYEKIKNVDYEAGFIIPENFGLRIRNGETPEIKVVKTPSSVEYMVVEGLINDIYTEIIISDGIKKYFDEKLDSMGVPQKEKILSFIVSKVDQNFKQPDVVSVKTSIYADKVESEEYDGTAQVSIGYLVMFVMFAAVFGAGEILEEKKNNTWGRLGITPTSRLEIISGKVLGTFLRGWVQVAFLILFGRFVMGISWGNSIFATMILVSAYLLSVTGVGMFLSSLVKTNSQLGAFGSIFIICTSMMSGCWWPIELQPLFMQQIATVFPQYWAMKGFINTVVGNMGIQSVMKPVAVLTAIGGVFFLLSIFSGRFSVEFKRPKTATTSMDDIF